MSGQPGDGAMLRVEVVGSPCPGRVERVELRLPAGATLADALRASALAVPAGASLGIWGRLFDPAAAGATLLRDRDRVEYHRALAVDPMEARRRRALAQSRRGPAAPAAGRR